MVAVAIGGAVLGAGSSIIAGNKAAGAAKSAAKSNNALQEEIYNSNAAALAPYEQTGSRANSAIAALLGLGGTTASAASGATAANQVNVLLSAAHGPNLAKMQSWLSSNPNATDDQKLAALKGFAGHDASSALANYVASNPYQPAVAGTSAQDAASAQEAAYKTFQNSDGYQFRLKQGQDSVTAALGAKGLTDSGAALKALTEYGQNAASDEFGKYLGYLTGQQGVGLTAASAQAEVGQNYANGVSQNNNNAASAAGSAALNTGNAINSALGNSLSAYTLSSALGSGYGTASLADTANYGLGGIY